MCLGGLALAVSPAASRPYIKLAMVDGNRSHAPHVLLRPAPLFGGFMAACFALWFVSVGISLAQALPR